MGEVDKSLSNLKRMIEDENSNTLVVTSDKEFDDSSVDPRYENNKNYKPIITETEKPLTVPKNTSRVEGLYKGNNLNLLPLVDANRSKNEQLQKEKVRKSLEKEKQRRILRTKEESKQALSEFTDFYQKSKTMREEAIKREKEELKRRLNQEYRSGFEVPECQINYSQTVLSNKDKMSDNYNPIEDPAFDVYSHKYIGKRYIPFEDLKQCIKDTQTFTVTHFVSRYTQNSFKSTYPNFILCGVITRKYPVAFSKDGKKYLKLYIGDFHFEVLLIIANDAFEKYWKLNVGSIVAILNPEIMPPTSTIKTHFLRVAYDTNSIISYASFRDFGYCAKNCKTAVDLKKGRYCPYHANKRSDETASKRNEMGTNYRVFAPMDNKGNAQVMVMTEKQIESRQLLEENINLKKKSGLAIEDVLPNPPLYPVKTEMVTTDYSNPITIENIKSKEEHDRIKFSSYKASAAFRFSNRVNKEAVKEQEEAHKLDRKLKRKQMAVDPQLLKEHKKAIEAKEISKKKKQKVESLMKTLQTASKADKTLKKNSSLIEAKKKRYQEADEKIQQYRKKKMPIISYEDPHRIEATLSNPKTQVAFYSSESEDLSDLEIY